MTLQVKGHKLATGWSDDGTELTGVCRCHAWEWSATSPTEVQLEHQQHLAMVLGDGENSMSSNTPAGWYPDPTKANTQRYWDGARWSEHLAPIPLPRAQPAYVEPPDNGGTLALGYIFAILMPIIGFIIGLTQINRRGGGVVVLSVVSFIVWLAILGG